METKVKKNVVVRSSASGVWHGQLMSWDAATRCAVLSNARKAWQWTGAAASSGLAVRGPSGGKICEPVTKAIVSDVCEIIDTTEDADVRWEKVAPWKA